MELLNLHKKLEEIVSPGFVGRFAVFTYYHIRCQYYITGLQVGEMGVVFDCETGYCWEANPIDHSYTDQVNERLTFLPASRFKRAWGNNSLGYTTDKKLAGD